MCILPALLLGCDFCVSLGPEGLKMWPRSGIMPVGQARGTWGRKVLKTRLVFVSGTSQESSRSGRGCSIWDQFPFVVDWGKAILRSLSRSCKRGV